MNGLITFDKPLTVIPYHAFFGYDNLTSIIIPNTVIEIKTSAFAQCSNLRTVNIPNSVITLRSYAFSECDSLTVVRLPINVKVLSNNTFQYCSALTSINLGELKKLETIGSLCFGYCVNLKDIELPENIKEIQEKAFYQCTNLTTVRYKDVVYYDYASLTAALKRNGVVIGKNAFNYTVIYNQEATNGLINYEPYYNKFLDDNFLNTITTNFGTT